jgi:3-oxoadipate enol-lactonase
MIFSTDTGGTREAVLLVHAIGCDHRMWDTLEAGLASRFRVVRMDVRGHGRSDATPRPYSLEQLADDARDVLDARAIEAAHWVGLSMGGMIGQAFALRHPRRLRRLVIANSTSSYGADGAKMWEARAKAVEDGGMAAIKDLAMARYFSDEFRAVHPEVVERIGGQFLATNPQGYIGCCDAIRNLDYTSALPRIAAPTLVIAGGKDAGTPVAMSETIARAIPGAKLEVIPAAAHLSAVEDPAAFSALVRPFLESP